MAKPKVKPIKIKVNRTAKSRPKPFKAPKSPKYRSIGKVKVLKRKRYGK